MQRLIASLWVRLAVTVAVLGYLTASIDLGDAATAVGRIDLTTWALLVGVVAIERLLSAFRWIVLVRTSGIDLNITLGLRLFMVSSFLGSVTPSGVGGDVARLWEIMNRMKRRNEAVAVTAIDRWLGLTSLALLGAFGLANWNQTVDVRITTAVYLLLVSVIVGGLVGAFADHLLAAFLPTTWADRPMWSRLFKLSAVAKRLRGRWPSMTVAATLSLLAQSSRVVLAWLIGWGLGLDVPLFYYFVVMPLGIVLILVPISVGGFGPAQGVIVWMLRPVGVPDATSFVLSTIFILLGFVANIPGALLYLRVRRG